MLSHCCTCFCVVPPPPASPLWFVYFPSEIATVNGSSPVNCGTIFDSDLDTLLCDHPNTSVLFDGNVPTLAGLDGDKWASQLLTIWTNGISTHQIICQLGRPADFGGVNTVEIVLFNCPEWGISVQTISVLLGQIRLDPPPGGSSYHDVINKNITLTSCSSLVRVCVPVNTLLTLIALQFLPTPDSHWVHLAEVRFNGRDSTCLPDAVLNQTALLPETHTNLPPHTSAPPEGTPSTTLHREGTPSRTTKGTPSRTTAFPPEGTPTLPPKGTPTLPSEETNHPTSTALSSAPDNTGW